MSLDDATELVRQTLLLALIVSAPMLVIGLVVGVIVSLLQAITQIQEQSLSFVPKIVAMVASAVLSDAMDRPSPDRIRGDNVCNVAVNRGKGINRGDAENAEKEI